MSSQTNEVALIGYGGRRPGMDALRTGGPF